MRLAVPVPLLVRPGHVGVPSEETKAGMVGTDAMLQSYVCTVWRLYAEIGGRTR